LQCVNNECVNKCKAGETCCEGNCCPANYICCNGNCCPPNQICSTVTDLITGTVRLACRIPCGNSTCPTNEICCNGTCKTAGTVSQPEFLALYEDPIFRGDLVWVPCSFINDLDPNTDDPLPDNFYTACLLHCDGISTGIPLFLCQQFNCKCCDLNPNVAFPMAKGVINYTSPCDCAS
jgi:hypothetical protein